MKSPQKALIAASAAVLVVGAIYYVTRPTAHHGHDHGPGGTHTHRSQSAVASRPVAVSVEEAAEPAGIVITESEEYVEYSADLPPRAMDPEDQPRQFLTERYTGLSQIPAGFVATGIEMGPNGFQLVAAAPGSTARRTGELISPVYPFDFPSNAFAPMWLQELPAGTTLNLDMQFSPDGRTWSDWRYVEPDDESKEHMSPTFPDGRPNPNYEYELGAMFVWFVDQWTHVRYRVTMTSASDESPVFSAFRMFYQDSTMGEGKIGEIVSAPATGDAAPTTQTP